MKKALAAIVLLASSAGVFALPAAAHDREDQLVNRNYVSSRYDRRDYNRGWHDAQRFRSRDYRGYGYNRNWR
jgi:hypothetical protein